jgi:proteasome lid subunit RPN8/RPN11
MNVTVVFPQPLIEEIDAVARLPVETAGVLLASLVTTDGGEIRLLARKMRWVPDSSYIRRAEQSLSIASEGYVPFLAEAEAMNAVAVWVHTHPGIGSSPRPSEHDWEVDRQIDDLFRLRSGSSWYGTLIFSPKREGLAFSGYLQQESGEPMAIMRLWQVGDRFRLTRSVLLPAHEIHANFDRNVRALGGGVQQTLGDLRIGIVGCGGTGSAVAEQLARLGVRNFVLFDPDELSGSNVTRVYGSAPSDVGSPKVEVLARHLRGIAPETNCALIRSMITMVPAARRLCSCDVIFGCTDDNAGRLVLSRFSTYLLTPVIDSGQQPYRRYPARD